MGIKKKILIPAIITTLLVAASILVSSIMLFSNFIDRSTAKMLDSAAEVAVNNLNFLKMEAKAVSMCFATDPFIIDAIVENDRDKLLAHARALQDKTHVEFCTVTDFRGTVIARTHEPENYGDSVAHQTSVRSAMYGEALTAIEEDADIRLSVRSGSPVLNGNGEVIGVVSVGYRLDTSRFVDTIKEIMGCEAAIVLHGKSLSTTVTQRNNTRAVGVKVDPAVVDAVMSSNNYAGQLNLIERVATVNGVPVNGADGRALGVLFVGQYIDEKVQKIQWFIMSGSAITVIILTLSVISALFTVRHIVKPLRDMTRAASALAVGNTEIDIKVNTRDEMSTLADAFNRMIVDTQHQVQIIGHIANGDLEELPQVRSEKDVMTRALLKLDETIRAQAMSINEKHEQLTTALEEAETANNAKSAFLARMSHEMRTPLNAVIGLSEIALEGIGLEGDAQSNLEKIHKSGTTLLSIVNDILDISKIQSGKFEIIPAKYDVPSLVNNAVMQNDVRIGNRPIQFILNIDGDFPAWLLGDEIRVKQIISNLLSNAFKYTEEGTVALSLTCEREDCAVWVTIRVSDTGIGIQEENKKRLFSDYTQFGETSYHQAGGTGLGLAITKRLAEMMDGGIAVESEYGKGSVFTVKIKQQRVGDAVIGEDVAGSLKNFRYSGSPLNKDTRITRVRMPYASVLVVDDNVTNLEVSKGFLKPYGMRVDCVTSGLEAINAVREGKVKYSAICMDQMMPKMDGIETTRIIREEIGTEYARTVPIIAFTANAITGNEEMLLGKGFQAFISKPVEILKLDSVLNDWVRDKNIEEKTQNAEQAQRPRDKKTRSLDHVTIQGVDKRKALQNFDGDEITFMEILDNYASNTRRLLAELSERAASGNLKDYAILIHGIKSASYSICAQAAGKAAEELEAAAKAGDYDAVSVGHAHFEKIARALIAQIDRALSGETEA
ncbi:MAG: response regulator [Clostridiales bacterium]|jgi:signal transduction histidine kinase/DNA-binding response OmpR family regulator|nr:response regulator [Clostridiales bacterium]